ncbi:2833_t:CDS:2, partial [Dentiscutata heterogama]
MAKPKKIWDHFTKLGIVDRSTQERAKCNYCPFECASSTMSNLNNEHWANIIFPIFIFAKPTEQIQQNAINIANEIEKAILSINIIK